MFTVTKRHILLLSPFAGYILVVLPFLNQLPMHEEVIHLVHSSTWEGALQYFWHPPTYVLLAKLTRSVLGDSYKVLYLIGILSALINLYLIYRILNAMPVSGSLSRQWYLLVGMWIFVLMPIAVHGSLLLEIEGTVLTPMCLLAVWFYIKNIEEEDSIRFNVIAGLLFGLSMWAKYFATPFLLIFAVFLSQCSGGKPFLRAFRNLSIILTSALGFFIPTYLLYSYLFIPGINSFAFVFSEKPKEGITLFLSGKIIIPIVSKLTAFTFWFSPFFIAFLLYFGYKLLRRWREFPMERFFLISIFLIFIFYLIAHPYPFAESKYFYPMFPLVAILSSRLFAINKIKLPPLRYVFLIPIAGALMFFVLGDPLYKSLYFYRSQLTGRMVSYIGLYVFVNLAIFSIVYLILSRRVGGFINTFSSSLIYLTISASLSLFLNQAIGQYQTKYQYGETGIGETIAYVNSEIAHENKKMGKIILPGEINYYAGLNKASSFREFGISSDWRWIVERKVNILRLSPENLKLLNNRYDLIKQIGSYRIYKRKG